MSRSRRRTASCVVALVALAAGCKFEDSVSPTTQIVVDVDAEGEIRARLSELTIEVSSADHRDNLEALAGTFEQTIRPDTPALDESELWPIRLAFKPRSDNARRVFSLAVTARDVNGELVASARLITGYVENEIRYARVLLEAACLGVVCEELETCSGGGCVAGWQEPRDLPLFPGADAGVDAGEAGPPDSGHDAGDAGDAMMDAELDAEVDAGEAGPPPPDSGPPIDPCLIDNGGCDRLVSCEDLEGIPTCGACPSGFVDVNGNGTRCEDIDECKDSKGGCDALHGICTNTEGGRDCSCEPGYNGNGRSCSLNVPCSQGAGVCDALATCQDVLGQQLCVCNDGYQGDGGQCSDIDECERNIDECRLNADCVNNTGSFTCPCSTGYREVGTACEDVDECTANSDNCDSTPDACINTVGSFTCNCPAGYDGTGFGDTCSDRNECVLDTDNCDDTPNACVNEPGTYRCQCPSGYAGLGVGTGGCADINDCLPNPCGTGGNCTETAAGMSPAFTCSCTAGYMLMGGVCVNINECSPNPCGMGSCTETAPGTSPGYSCTCASGYMALGGTCVNINECMPNPCGTGGSCTETAPGMNPAFTCTCASGYMLMGGVCVNVNECAPNPCGPGTCAEDAPGTSPGYTCTCPSGYVAMGGTCADINECTPNPCGPGTCDQTVPGPGYSCTCPVGSLPMGGTCVDINECMPNPCGVGGTCTQTLPSGFSCMCAAGYVLESGTCVNVNECVSNPCMPGSTCTEGTTPGVAPLFTCACNSAASGTIAGNMGQTDTAASVYTMGNRVLATQLTTAAASSLIAFGAVPAMGSASPMFRMALYSDVAGSPGVPLFESETAPFSSARLRLKDNPAACGALPAGTYWLVAQANGPYSLGAGMAGAEMQYYDDEPFASPLPSPFMSTMSFSAPPVNLYIVTN